MECSEASGIRPVVRLALGQKPTSHGAGVTRR